MRVLEVRNLTKRYPSFTLQPISFSLAPGQITGFIGRNGAGKSTTLKSLLGFVQPDGGEVSFFGIPFAGHEAGIKQRIGFVAGGVDYYTTKPLRAITDVTRPFYPNWDDALYRHYLSLFHLEERKAPAQLSAGMRVKYALTLAMSHHAELLLLDEPTSGLDPVSRDEVLELLLQLCREGVTILFSTHITTDLDQCASRILYLQNGTLLADADLDDFVSSYRLATLPAYVAAPPYIGCKPAKQGYTALVRATDAQGLDTQPTGLTDIMVHLEKEVLQ